MDFSANLEIHFHDQQIGSVIFESTGGPDQQFGEVLLACSLALRQLVNIGDHPASRALAEMLVRAEPHLTELAHFDSPDGARLVRYQGAPGRRRFLASLTCTDDGFNFQMKAKGFGWLAAGVGYYAPQSVLLLLRYLALRRIDDQSYLRWLGAAAAACSRSFLDGAVKLTNQARIAAGAATASRETPEPPAASARPVQAPAVTPPVAEPAAAVEALLRHNGERLTVADLFQAFQTDSAFLTFEKLDQATQWAFHGLAKGEAEILRRACTAAASVPQDQLLLEIGKYVFFGYHLARRLLGTHATRFSISRDPQDADLKARVILRHAESLESVAFAHLLETIGDVGRFVTGYAEVEVRKGIYSRLPDADEAAGRVCITMFRGFTLGIAEYDVADPSTKSRLSRENCLTIGRSLARHAIDDFQRDRIDELNPLGIYSTLSAAHKATWLCLRLALQLRCVEQIATLSDDQRQVICAAAVQAIADGGLGIASVRFAELSAFEKRMCGTGPHACGRATELPATQYLLFGFIGCFVNNCGITPLRMGGQMARCDAFELNAWLRERGATVEIPLDPFALLEYSRLAFEKVALATALVNRGDQIR